MNSDSRQDESNRTGPLRHSVDDRRDDGRPHYRVAVTVFATARGNNAREAAMAVRMAVQSAVAGAGDKLPAGPTRVAVDGAVSRFAPKDRYVMVDVHEVVDMSVALAGGYLWCEPTRKAFSGDSTSGAETHNPARGFDRESGEGS